ADLLQQRGESRERALEGTPVIAVESTPDFLADPGRRLAPDAVPDRFVTGLQIMQPGRQEIGIRGPDQQVVEVAPRLVLDPVPLVLVEDRSPALLEGPPATGILLHQR